MSRLVITVDEAVRLVQETFEDLDAVTQLAGERAVAKLRAAGADLLGNREVADRLSVTTSNVGKVRGLEPVQHLGSSRRAVYLSTEVEAVRSERRRG